MKLRQNPIKNLTPLLFICHLQLNKVSYSSLFSMHNDQLSMPIYHSTSTIPLKLNI